MTIISVAGSSSNSGKTSLAVSILKSISKGDWTAIKSTTVFDSGRICPRGSNCNVCGTLDREGRDFKIIRDEHIILEPGTDTERLAHSGAKGVIWCISAFHAIERAWAGVREILEPDEKIVMEGNSILTAVDPDLSLLVINPYMRRSRWKDSTERLIKSADYVCINVNRLKGDPRGSQIVNEVADIRGRDDLIFADVTISVCEWEDKAIYERLMNLNGGVSYEVPQVWQYRPYGL